MSPAECLRDLISERLTAAAEEIFSVCQRTIEQYEEEIHRQRRLLEIFMKPKLKLQRTEFLRQHICKEEEELCTGLDQEHLEPLQIKEEQKEIRTGLDVEQLVLKQEAETFMLTPVCEERNYSEAQTLDLSCAVTQNAAEQHHIVIMSVKGSEKPDQRGEELLFSNSSHIAERQDHNGGEQGDMGSSRNVESRPKKRRHKSKNRTNVDVNSATPKIPGNSGTQRFECDICGKDFKTKSYLLKLHQRVHTGERPYPCNTCGKRFSESGALKVHMRTHTGERPYPCNTCGKRFAKLGTLKVHMKIHTGERPYPCNTCGKRFSLLETLKSHMRIHTGERPYPCNTCEKRFSGSGALKVHMRTHTGERPYPCNTCGKRFAQLSNLKVHNMKVHHVNKP